MTYDKKTSPSYYFDKYRTPDPDQTKEVRYGKRHFTAIDPMYQLKLATEEWGAYGDTWGVRQLDYQIIDREGGSVATLNCMFYYPDGEFSMGVDMGFRANDDCFKKLLTSARSKSLSLLGFGADVYMGKFEDDAYVKMAEVKHGDTHEFFDKAADRINACNGEEEMKLIFMKIYKMKENSILPEKDCNDLLDILNARCHQLEIHMFAFPEPRTEVMESKE